MELGAEAMQELPTVQELRRRLACGVCDLLQLLHGGKSKREMLGLGRTKSQCFFQTTWSVGFGCVKMATKAYPTYCGLFSGRFW